jgi:hypothetical protein
MMRSAAACTVFFVLALGVSSSGAAAAGPLDPVTSSLTGDVQNQAGSVVSDPIESTTGTVSNVTGAVSGATGSVSGTVDTVSDAADDATGGATGPVSGAVDDTVSGVTGSATGAVDSVVGSVSGTGGSSGSGGGALGSGGTSSTTPSGGSGSVSDGGSTARTRDARSGGSNRSPQTAFNRLPRRYEALLERIEAGQHVRASIARLRALLASASPQLRARILRLIGVEIRRLERGGVTRRERAMLERLRRLRSAFATNIVPQVGQSSLPLPAGSSVATGLGRVDDVGRNASFGGSERPAKDHETGGGSGLIALPSVPGPPYLLLLLLGTLACGLLVAAAASRQVLPARVRAVLAAHGGAQLSAFAATIGLIIAVGVGFMIQAFLP